MKIIILFVLIVFFKHSDACNIEMKTEKSIVQSIEKLINSSNFNPANYGQISAEDIPSILDESIIVSTIDEANKFAYGYNVYIEKSKKNGCLYLVYIGGYSGFDRLAYGPLK